MRNSNADVKFASVSEAARCVTDGGIIAYPTEAVYGLGCDPNNTAALERLVGIKKRAVSKGFILVASNFEQLQPFIAPLTETERQTVMKTWPGPVTWVVAAAEHTSMLLTGGRETLAVRISAHPVVRELCQTLGFALVSTSANLSGTTSITNPDILVQQFGHGIDMLVEGALGEEHSATAIFELATGIKLR